MGIIEQIDARFSVDDASGVKIPISRDEWNQIKAKVREDALEEAAKACDEISEKYYQDEHRRFPELKTDAEAGADDCAIAIRELKSKD